ncbi:SPOR domain-containing protein [Orbaceae bacterium ac157xtp]
MAQRDYVKKKGKPKNKSRLIPNIMMAIAILLVVLFIAILYFVSTNKAPKPAKQPTTTITQKPQNTLPDKPQERWTYLKELENPQSTTVDEPTQPNKTEQANERQNALANFLNDKKESTPTIPTPVETTQQNSKPNPTTNKTFLMQCGAFKDKANAESLKAKLAMFGVTSYIKSDKFHRVMAGPYASRAEVEKTITTLKNNGINGCINAGK